MKKHERDQIRQQLFSISITMEMDNVYGCMSACI